MRKKFAILISHWICALIVTVTVTGCSSVQKNEVFQEQSNTPRLGLLIPVGPADYKLIFDALENEQTEQRGPFVYHTGTIHGVPVVVSIAPVDGPLMRSLAAQKMLEHYNVRAFLYPGTSGAHLGPDQMKVGDVVLGAANVNHGNFFMSKEGQVIGNEFGHEETGRTKFDTLYLDPQLLSYLACSAQRVTRRTELPDWLNPGYDKKRSDLFFYGIQGTGTMWLANTELIEKIHNVFHEMDEDGDWYSNLVATLYHVPFIEVSTIADSIFELPHTDRGIPVPTSREQPSASVVAQRISNRIMLDLIEHKGASILREHYDTPIKSPFDLKVFENPKHPTDLLKQSSCVDY